MGRDHPPFLGGNRSQLSTRMPVERLELRLVMAEPLLIDFGARRIDAGQSPRNISRVNDAVAHILPGMWVGRECCLASLGCGDRSDPLCGYDDRPAVSRGRDQPRQPPFEAETVDDEELGMGQQANLIRTRLEDVLIRIAPDQACHHGVAAANLARDVFEDAEGDEHSDPRLRCRDAPGGPGENETKSRETPAHIARAHRVSYHLHPVARKPAHEL